MNRDRFVPGNICHAPNETPEPDMRAFCKRFADFIIEAMVSALRGCDTDEDRYVNCQGRTVYAHRSENKCFWDEATRSTKLNVQLFEMHDDIGKLEKCKFATHAGEYRISAMPGSPLALKGSVSYVL
jgi:hypothetical protein